MSPKGRIGTTSRDAVLGLLGLATRAGQVAIGTEQVRSLVGQGRVRFVLVASDLTANGRRRIVPMLERRGLAYAERHTRDELGESVGRGPTGAVGLMDARLAERIRKLLEGSSVR
ncbi:MAG: ribosomal L7Ae/L30e/S12e/Gadd45 family protein [Gemmatimonadota bacterium]